MAARTGKAKLAGVIGYPVGHSLSPALHEFWLRRYDIDGAYVPLTVTPEDFSQTLEILARIGFQGMNVTLPHKEAAFALASEHDDAARLTGAVNTLIRKEDGSYYGKNTDVSGFLENLKGQGIDPASVRQAVILGAGGAARGVAAGLLASGCEMLCICNRSQERAEHLRTVLHSAFPDRQITIAAWEDRLTTLTETDLLVNTTQLGMKGQPALEIRLDTLPAHAAVADIVYNPLVTPLLLDAEKRGYKIVTGLGMLLHQAVPGFEAWFSVRPEVTPELHDYIAAMIVP